MMAVTQEMADMANRQIEAHFMVRPITIKSSLADIISWLGKVRDDLPRYISHGAAPITASWEMTNGNL